eukprot:scaffold11978_cov65-Phaeocystis_antarctica.AAC.2
MKSTRPVDVLQRGRGVVPARQGPQQRHVPLQVQRHRAHAHLGRPGIRVIIVPSSPPLLINLLWLYLLTLDAHVVCRMRAPCASSCCTRAW